MALFVCVLNEPIELGANGESAAEKSGGTEPFEDPDVLDEDMLEIEAAITSACRPCKLMTTSVRRHVSFSPITLEVVTRVY